MLLDTNVISELVRPRRSPAVVAYLSGLEPDQSYLSLISVGEIERGIAQVAQSDAPQRAIKLRNWLDGQVVPQYAGRLLPLDEPVIRRWGELMALPEVRARSGIAIEALIAATASVHRLTLVTRNSRDFAVFPVASYDPWTFPLAPNTELENP
ncbi:type II toxin-antitoxin system VapC family toxin (plasmid) [Deinococcus psychrotolerans]|uniref:Ribonuclease VapC n=1 Tax=Deinococcus psychrotolerans TaxID=2489213 RepID=A0A3G8YKR6_9DEIO|nr:type II toxin-antitoxin system VapC family toxin [Deinococcus psychrotolerans]